MNDDFTPLPEIDTSNSLPKKSWLGQQVKNVLDFLLPGLNRAQRFAIVSLAAVVFGSLMMPVLCESIPLALTIYLPIVCVLYTIGAIIIVGAEEVLDEEMRTAKKVEKLLFEEQQKYEAVVKFYIEVQKHRCMELQSQMDMFFKGSPLTVLNVSAAQSGDFIAQIGNHEFCKTFSVPDYLEQFKGNLGAVFNCAFNEWAAGTKTKQNWERKLDGYEDHPDYDDDYGDGDDHEGSI